MGISGRLGRIGAAVAAAGLVFGLSIAPAGSQVPGELVTLTGSSECQVSGLGIWSITFTFHSNLNEGEGDIAIDGATVTVEGDPEPIDAVFDPNPVAPGGDATTGGELLGEFAGTVSISVDWSAVEFDDSGTATAEVTLDGSCVAPAEPTVPVTDPPAALPADVTPAFTG